MSVAQSYKTKLGAAPEDDILAQTREMDAAERDGEEKFGHKVAVADGVHAVLGNGTESQLLGHKFAIDD